MESIIKLLFVFCLYCNVTFSNSQPSAEINSTKSSVREQVPLEGNIIRSFIWNSGVFNQDIRTNNTPGFEWPKNSGKFAIFTTGLTIGAYVNNQLRLSTASFSGEYVPGYCVNGVLQTNASFKLYSVKAGDNQFTNPDYANWGLMVPYGAPYKDINNNGTFEVSIDIPGVKDASQTVFICMTDADPTAHSISEGFAGGTDPLFNEVHMTSWCYSQAAYERVQFFKWVVINKSTNAWDSTLASIVCDPDIGDAADDYIGCDTLLNMGYCYNADNNDGTGSGNTYGANPPASGIMYLNCNNGSAVLSSFNYFTNSNSPGPACERDPTNPQQSYWFMKGLKNDGTPWINILNLQPSKYCYPGDRELSTGWTEFNGRIENCDGSLSGTTQIPSPPGDRRFLLNYKPAIQRLNPGDSIVISAAQFVARGNNNLNSVTLLRRLADSVKTFCQGGFLIGINPISTNVPGVYSLHQNYPNPFNPVTKINFALPKSGNVTLKIYDMLGREIAVLVSQDINAGEYSVDWNAAGYSSGVYFYKLESGDFSEVKKMMIVK